MTLAELKLRALKRLRVLAAGETAPAYVDDIVDQAYTSVYEELQEDNLISWTVTGAIPDKVALKVIDMVVNESADEFGVAEQRILRIDAKATRSKKEIRSLMAPKYVPSDSEATYY